MSDEENAAAVPLDELELVSVKEELRQARADLDRFAYFVSHDFRAPLRHITAFSGLLENELQAHENADVATWLGFLGSGARLIQELTDAVLAYSRARREKPRSGATPVARMLEGVQATLRRGELLVTNDIAADVVVAMPPLHTNQVFAELFRNAINFCKEGESAQVSLTCRSVAEGKAWEIVLRDEGRGIREEQLEQVFEPFYRSSDSPRSSPGLGLSVARHLLSLYGGTIAIESKVDAFSIVRVSLPAVTAKEEEDSSARAATTKEDA